MPDRSHARRSERRRSPRNGPAPQQHRRDAPLVTEIEYWRTTWKALWQLAPVVRAGHGVAHFALATGGWVAQTVTEWGVAALLFIFLMALGLLPADSVPDWLPPAIVDLGIPSIWAALVGLAALQSIFQIVSFQSRALFSQGIDARLRMMLAHTALARGAMPPDLSRMNYLTGEVFPRTTSFFYHLSQVSCFALQTIALGAAMFRVEPQSALVSLAGLGAIGTLVLFFNHLNNRASARLPQAQKDFEQSKVRLSRNWLYLRALRLEHEEYRRQLDATGRIYRDNLTGFFFGNLGGMLGPVFGVALVSLIVLVHAAAGTTPAAALLPFFYLLFRFQQIVASASHLVGGLFTYRVHLLEAANFVAGFSPADRAQALSIFPPVFLLPRSSTPAREPVGSAPAGCEASPAPPPPSVTVRDLGFRWPGSPSPLLSHLSFELPAGKQLAIVGANGAGKSTLLALVLGALQPTEGAILLDGIESEGWVTRHRAWTAFVGAVPYLVGGTVRENLVYGLQRQPREAELWTAMRQVGLAARVESSPAGLEHRLGENGDGLSAGEQQKLAIARALLRKPRILVLDEPTAHIDDRSEQEIRRALQKLDGECTVIVVSHKQGVMHDADQILRLEDAPAQSPGPCIREVMQ